MDEKETLRQMYRQYWAYMIACDGEGLRGLMAEEYVLTHMTGVRQSREAFLRGLRDGTFRYYSADHASVEVELHGDTATLIGKSRVLAAVYGGGKHLWRLRGDFTLRKENGTWRFIESRASTW